MGHIIYPKLLCSPNNMVYWDSNKHIHILFRTFRDKKICYVIAKTMCAYIVVCFLSLCVQFWSSKTKSKFGNENIQKQKNNVSEEGKQYINLSCLLKIPVYQIACTDSCCLQTFLSKLENLSSFQNLTIWKICLLNQIFLKKFSNQEGILCLTLMILNNLHFE